MACFKWTGVTRVDTFRGEFCVDVEFRNVGAGFVTWATVANPRTLDLAKDLAALLGAFPDELAPLLTALFQERSNNAGASITFEF